MTKEFKEPSFTEMTDWLFKYSGSIMEIMEANELSLNHDADWIRNRLFQADFEEAEISCWVPGTNPDNEPDFDPSPYMHATDPDSCSVGKDYNLSDILDQFIKSEKNEGVEGTTQKYIEEYFKKKS